jgi:hypothetical protein
MDLAAMKIYGFREEKKIRIKQAIDFSKEMFDAGVEFAQS